MVEEIEYVNANNFEKIFAFTIIYYVRFNKLFYGLLGYYELPQTRNDTATQRGYLLIARAFSMLTWSAVTMAWKLGKVDKKYIMD